MKEKCCHCNQTSLEIKTLIVNFINLIEHKAGSLTAPDSVPLPIVPVGVGGGRPPSVPVRVLATPLLPSSLVQDTRQSDKYWKCL